MDLNRVRDELKELRGEVIRVKNTKNTTIKSLTQRITGLQEEISTLRKMIERSSQRHKQDIPETFEREDEFFGIYAENGNYGLNPQNQNTSPHPFALPGASIHTDSTNSDIHVRSRGEEIVETTGEKAQVGQSTVDELTGLEVTDESTNKETADHLHGQDDRKDTIGEKKAKGDVVMENGIDLISQKLTKLTHSHRCSLQLQRKYQSLLRDQSRELGRGK